MRLRRPAIEALALGLAERHRLTGEEAAAVVRAVDPAVEVSIAWVRCMVPHDLTGYEAFRVG